MLEILGSVFLWILFVIFALALLMIPAMDMLTYGNPPGLFKNKFWQQFRKIWTRGK